MTSDLSAEELLAAYGLSAEEAPGAEPRGVLAVAHCRGDALDPESLGALGVAREIADALGARLTALLLGGAEEQARALIRGGADAVLMPAAPRDYDQAAWTDALAAAIEQQQPEVVLLGGSDAAYDIAPRAAQCRAAGLIAGARQVRPEAEGRLAVAMVPLYGGRLLGEFDCPDRRPQMIALAPGAGPPPGEDPTREGEIQPLIS